MTRRRRRTSRRTAAGISAAPAFAGLRYSALQGQEQQPRALSVEPLDEPLVGRIESREYRAIHVGHSVRQRKMPERSEAFRDGLAAPFQVHRDRSCAVGAVELL